MSHNTSVLQLRRRQRSSGLDLGLILVCVCTWRGWGPGDVVNVRVPPWKDFAFIEFTTHQHAQKAIDSKGEERAGKQNHETHNPEKWEEADPEASGASVTLRLADGFCCRRRVWQASRWGRGSSWGGRPAVPNPPTRNGHHGHLEREGK